MSSNDPDMFPPKHYEAIGRLIISCSQLESRLTELISIFSGMHLFCGMITVHHQQFSSKVGTLKALVHSADPKSSDKSSELIKTIDKAKAIYDYRSTLVHGIWGVDDDGHPRTARFTARGEFRRSRVSHPIQKILERAREADELADLLAKLRDHLHSTRSDPSKSDQS